MQFYISFRMETGKEITEPLRLQFFEKFELKLLVYQMQKTIHPGC